MKRDIYLADINKQKLSRMDKIDLEKKGALQKYLKENLKIYPNAIWIKIWGFDFSPISRVINSK